VGALAAAVARQELRRQLLHRVAPCVRVGHGRGPAAPDPSGYPGTLVRIVVWRRGAGAYQCITMPPSTLIVCPVTFFARFDARNTAIAATSSGSCQRPSGTRRRIFSPAQSSYDCRSCGVWSAAHAAHTERFSSVLTIPGHRALTRTPWGARS